MKYITRHYHWLFAILALLLSSCDGFGCSSNVVAELTSRTGNVERDYAANMNYWESAPISTTFVTNDGVRTRNKSSAELTLMDGSLVVMNPSTQLRFADSVPKQKKFGVVVESGSAQIEAKSDDLQIETGIGLARLKKGSAMTLKKDQNQLAVQLDIGSAQFVGSDGKALEVGAGEEIILDIGTAQIVSRSDTLVEASDGSDDVEMDFHISETTDDGDDSDDDADRSGGRSGDNERTRGIPEDKNSSEQADFKIVAGERIFIHAMHAPVAVEFDFSELCPEEGYVKVSRKKIWATGRGSVILNLPLRGNGYEVRCVEGDGLGRVAKKGRITVLRDKGKSQLSLKAPVSYVDADGRDYNLLYQSKLPQVVVKWPDAPSATGYKLHFTGDSGTKTVNLNSPQYRFASGALKEGYYKFKFIAAGSGQRSRTSSIKIRFDNATPKAILKSPRDAGYASGGAVDVNGIALPGWTASVYGQRLTMDGQHRFSGNVQHRRQYLSLPVKLTHAKRGTHYFLRRAR